MDSSGGMMPAVVLWPNVHTHMHSHMHTQRKNNFRLALVIENAHNEKN